MRIPINLASEPFRNDRPMIVASVAVAIGMSVVLGMLVYIAKQERDQAADARALVERLQRDLATVKRDEARYQGVLRLPENAQVFERSIFLNSIIQRKGVSWTRMFADLESVMPHDVRLVSIRPEVTAQNDVQLEMVVGSQSIEPVVNMLMKLEASPLFGPTTLKTTLPPSQTEPLYRCRVTVSYAQKL